MEPRTTNVRSPLSLGLSHHQQTQQQMMTGAATQGSTNNTGLDYLNGGRSNAADIPRNSSNDLSSPGPSNDILSNNNNAGGAAGSTGNEHLLHSAAGGQNQHHQGRQSGLKPFRLVF